MQTEHILQVKQSNKHKHLLNPSLAFEDLITDIVGVSWLLSERLMSEFLLFPDDDSVSVEEREEVEVGGDKTD